MAPGFCTRRSTCCNSCNLTTNFADKANKFAKVAQSSEKITFTASSNGATALSHADTLAISSTPTLALVPTPTPLSTEKLFQELIITYVTILKALD